MINTTTATCVPIICIKITDSNNCIAKGCSVGNYTFNNGNYSISLCFNGISYLDACHHTNVTRNAACLHPAFFRPNCVPESKLRMVVGRQNMHRFDCACSDLRHVDTCLTATGAAPPCPSYSYVQTLCDSYSSSCSWYFNSINYTTFAVNYTQCYYTSKSVQILPLFSQG